MRCQVALGHSDNDISDLEYWPIAYNTDNYKDIDELKLRNDVKKIISKCKTRTLLVYHCVYLLKCYLNTLARQDIENKKYYIELCEMGNYEVENNTIEIMGWSNNFFMPDKYEKKGSINLDTMKFEVLKPCIEKDLHKTWELR